MKIKYIILSFFVLLITYSHNLKTENYQYLNFENEFQHPYKNPFAPIEFTAEGLNNFFENIYNQYWYGKEFLPSNFTHMIQFLEFGKQTKQQGAFFKSVLKLFGNKLKSSSYVNSYAFIELLNVMPNLTKQYFIIPEANIFEYNKKLINNIMYKSFLSEFSVFKKDPKVFLKNLSENILQTLNKQSHLVETHVNMEHLRQSLVRFLELAIAKLIWSPEDHKNIWDLFYATAKKIEAFANNKIIADLDNLDDIYWSLIYRFCFFLELAAQELPIDFYLDFKNKLAACDLCIFQIEEQEQSIKTKHTQLVQALFEGEAKARAYKSGIIVN